MGREKHGAKKQAGRKSGNSSSGGRAAESRARRASGGRAEKFLSGKSPEWLVFILAEDKRHIRAFLALSVVLMCVFFIFAALSQPPNFVISNESKGESVKAYMEIASNDFSRMRGLMFRDRIIAILFDFNSNGKYPIHSNFVAAPFDAVYLSEGGEVVEIFRKIPPSTQLVSPQKPARYLLELPVETFDALSIEAGDKISWKKIGNSK